jgi:hypothetical protein
MPHGVPLHVGHDPTDPVRFADNRSSRGDERRRRGPALPKISVVSFTLQCRRLDEPRVALIGVDNAEARRPLSFMPFDFIVEAVTTTSGVFVSTAFRVKLILRVSGRDSEASQAAVQAPAYEKMLKAGASRCGVTMLASRAVGAPFVGCFAASLVVAEVLRMLHGGERYAAIDLSLQSLRAGTVAAAKNPNDLWTHYNDTLSHCQGCSSGLLPADHVESMNVCARPSP